MSWTYRGERTAEGCRVFKRYHSRPRNQEVPLPMRHDIRNHSPDGPEWGYCGSGPAQLALALLMHATRHRRTAEQLYQRFKADVVAGLPHDGWEMSSVYILEWAAEQLAGPIT
jgi:hypothetical protein